MRHEAQQLLAGFPRRLSQNKGELKLATTAAVRFSSIARVSLLSPVQRSPRPRLTRSHRIWPLD